MAAALSNSIVLAVFLVLGAEGARTAAPVTVSEKEPPLVQVPFGCDRAFPVSQAHSTGSHVLRDEYAWDFRMPVGEPIVAALDGVVRLLRGDSTRGGCDISFAREANYVVLSHEGGLETQYLHFSEVVVKAGDRVKAGQLLGYSGTTGWACGAHLHFKVSSAGDGWNNASVPARIAGYGDAKLGFWVSSPRCSTERPYLASQPKKAEIRTAARLVPEAADGGQGASPPAAVAPP